MYRYLRLLGWGLLIGSATFLVAGYVSLAVADGLTALIDYLTSSFLLTLGSVVFALVPGYALIKIGGWLEARESDETTDLFEDDDLLLEGDNSRNGDGEFMCNVCSLAPAVGVFSSRYGPVSHAACEVCSNEGAEPLYMACFHIHNAGGPEKAQDRFAEIRSYHDGRYIGLAEILAVYPEFADEFEDVTEEDRDRHKTRESE